MGPVSSWPLFSNLELLTNYYTQVQTETLSIENINVDNGGIETGEFEDSFTNAEVCMDTNVVSSAGKKRKLSKISSSSEVSSPQKRACIESVKNVQSDHAYHVSCPIVECNGRFMICLVKQIA